MREETGRADVAVDEKCHTGIPGVYALGDFTTIPYKQVIIAEGEGVKAALSASDFFMNQK